MSKNKQANKVTNTNSTSSSNPSVLVVDVGDDRDDEHQRQAEVVEESRVGVQLHDGKVREEGDRRAEDLPMVALAGGHLG